MDLKRERKFGIKKGEKSGLKKGEKFGLEKGIKQTQIQVVKAMLKKNMDINEISEITGLSKEEIENISKN